MNYKNIIKEVSFLLNISPPRLIKNDIMAFSYVPKIDTIFYKNIDYNTTLFLILHELRHKYQYIYNKDIFKYNKYYYSSISELDSYAYAYYMIKTYFKINYVLSFPLTIILKEYLNYLFIKDLM